jgi:hypothetical protein
VGNDARLRVSLDHSFSSPSRSVQDEFESKGLKPVFHFTGSRVGSPGAFKRYGSTGFNVYSPNRRRGT